MSIVSNLNTVVNPDMSLTELADSIRRCLWRTEYCLYWPALARELEKVEADIHEADDVQRQIRAGRGRPA